MSRPPYQPSTRAGRRTAIAFIMIVVAFAIIAYAVAFWPRDDSDDPTTPEDPIPVVTSAAGGLVLAGSPRATFSSPAALPVAGTAVPVASPDVVRPTPPAAVGSPPATSDASFRAACQNECLVRLDDDPASVAALASRGLRPAFVAAEHLWAGVAAVDVEALRAGGTAVAVVDESVETLHLYAVRTAEEDDDAPVRGFGEIVDEVGNQYIVRVPKAPAAVGSLTAAGIWVEKFPPLPPAQIAARGSETLTADGLGALVGTVSTEELWATVVDLQGMSSTDGTGIGTRHYATTGNVMAAEYLHRRFTAYGLDVRYEDFVTGDGLLALNVVAEIPGSDPSQVYVVMGHFDSMNNSGDYGTAPGADDNASGVAGMLEIARILAGYELEHSVVFFATNVEEVGLQGVQAFAARAASEGRTITAAFNLDAIGSPYQGSQIIVNADGNAVWLRDLLIGINGTYGLGQAFLIPEDPSGIVADDTVLRDWGFPTVLLARELFGWTPIHHSPQDVAENVDFYNVRMATELALVSTATLLTD